MLTEVDAADHCNRTFRQPYPNDGKLYCDVTFDGVLCWNYTLAGTRAYGGCPVHHPASHVFTPAGYSFKDCLENGTWYTYPGTSKEWSNYTLCALKDNVENSRRVIYVYIGGYTLSLLFLLGSLLIFTYLRDQLKSTRVRLHKHLFLSYVLTGALWILYYLAALLNRDVLKENPDWCKVLHIATQYCTLSNYAWMFAEGFFLHSSIVFTFTSGKRLFAMSIVIGWVIPILISCSYAIARAVSLDPNDHTECWVQRTPLLWILMTPIIVSLCVNFLFLINIMRIFVSKLGANNYESNKIRQTARACLILIPLLGIQFVIFPLRPHKEIFAYNVTVAVFNSFQGAFVAAVFCFFNGEVINTFRKHVSDIHRTNGRKISLSSIGTSLRRLSQSSMTRRASTPERYLSNARQVSNEKVKSLNNNSQKPLINGNNDLCSSPLDDNGKLVSTENLSTRYTLVPITEV